MGPLKLSSEVKDINLTNSCNCCCGSFKKKKSPEVYVTSAGIVELFKKQKADTDALQRSVVHLTKAVAELARAKGRRPSVVVEKITKNYELTHAPVLRLDTVQRILEEVDTFDSIDEKGLS